MKGERPVGFDTAVMAHFGDWNDKYYDGSIGGSFGTLIGNISPFQRDDFGYKTGEVDAASIIAGLARNDKGEITETIKIIAHSMGAAYAKGFIRALVEYARKNPELCTGLSVSEYDFAPFQPTSQRAVNGVSTFQYSHSKDKVAEYGRMPGAEFMDTPSDREQGHPIRNFYDLIRNLPEGKYVFVDEMPLKVN